MYIHVPHVWEDSSLRYTMYSIQPPNYGALYIASIHYIQPVAPVPGPYCCVFSAYAQLKCAQLGRPGTEASVVYQYKPAAK